MLISRPAPSTYFNAVLAVIVKLAGDTIFAKFCQDALSHILRHPRSIQTRDVVGMARMGWDGLVWVEMDGHEWGWVGMGVWVQLDGWVTRWVLGQTGVANKLFCVPSSFIF